MKVDKVKQEVIQLKTPDLKKGANPLLFDYEGAPLTDGFQSSGEKLVPEIIQKNNCVEEVFYIDSIEQMDKLLVHDSFLKDKMKELLEDQNRIVYSVTKRLDGTVYKETAYINDYFYNDPDEEKKPFFENKYDKNGTYVQNRKYQFDFGYVQFEKLRKDGTVAISESYSKWDMDNIRGRTVFNKDGSVYLQVTYNHENKIIDFKKNTNGDFDSTSLNGKIDTTFGQGKTGICYIASTVKEMVDTPLGFQIVDDALDYNEETQTGTVDFKGLGVKYSFSKQEIIDAMDRLGTGDPDFTLLALGYEKYREENNLPVDSGTGYEIVYALTGKRCESNIYRDKNGNAFFYLGKPDLFLDEISKVLSKENGIVVLGPYPDSLGHEFTEEDKERGLSPSHAYSVTKIENGNLYLNEPNSNQEVIISLKELGEKFATVDFIDLGAVDKK